MRVTRWVMRLCVAGAVVSATAGVVGPTAASVESQVGTTTAQAGTRPPSYGSSTYAAGVRFEANTRPEQIVPEVLAPTSPESESSFATGQAAARASLFDPGLLVTAGPGLICTAGFPCQEITIGDQSFPPPFPTVAEASHPDRPEDRATAEGQTIDGGGYQQTAGEAVARASLEAASTLATASDVSFGQVAGPETAALFIGSVETTTDHRFDPDGTLVVTARSFASDILIGAGAITIDSVETISTSRTNGNDVAETTARTVVSGAEAGGQPIDITDEGVAFGPDPEGGDVLDQISSGGTEALSPVSGDVRTVGSTTDTQGTRTEGAATGLLVHMEADAGALPAGATVLTDVIIGNVSSLAFADLSAGGTGIPAVTVPPTTIPAPVPTAPDELTSGGFFELPESITVPPEPAPVPAQEPASRTVPGSVEQVLLGLLAGDRMKLFYLAWTLSMLALALGSRTRPARLVAPPDERIPG